MRSLYQNSSQAIPRDTAPPLQRALHRPAPVHITALSEQTAGLDESLGALLGDMRRALGMTPGELALRLGTSVDVILLLEQGRVRALPHWDETQRIIVAFCALHRVEPRPILQRIFEQASATHVGRPPEGGARPLRRVAPAPQQATRRPAPAAPKSAPKHERRRWALNDWCTAFSRPSLTRPGRRRGRALMAVAGPLVLVAVMVWTVQAQPRILRDAIGFLPPSLSGPMLSTLDDLAVHLAPKRDGLRWIDVSDPASRKADKLQVGLR